MDIFRLRNLSFESMEEDLEEFMEEQFGEVTYCRVVTDKAMEHSKGLLCFHCFMLLHYSFIVLLLYCFIFSLCYVFIVLFFHCIILS